MHYVCALSLYIQCTPSAVYFSYISYHCIQIGQLYWCYVRFWCWLWCTAVWHGQRSQRTCNFKWCEKIFLFFACCEKIFLLDQLLFSQLWPKDRCLSYRMHEGWYTSPHSRSKLHSLCKLYMVSGHYFRLQWSSFTNSMVCQQCRHYNKDAQSSESVNL